MNATLAANNNNNIIYTQLFKIMQNLDVINMQQVKI